MAEILAECYHAPDTIWEGVRMDDPCWARWQELYPRPAQAESARLWLRTRARAEVDNALARNEIGKEQHKRLHRYIRTYALKADGTVKESLCDDEWHYRAIHMCYNIRNRLRDAKLWHAKPQLEKDAETAWKKLQAANKACNKASAALRDLTRENPLVVGGIFRR